VVKLRAPFCLDPPPDPRLTSEALVRWIGPTLTERRRSRIERVVHGRLAGVTVVFERLYDPHNGSAAMRTCEALGLLNVHVVPGPDHPFPFARRVSQNAHKWLNVWFHRSIEGCLGELRTAGFESWAAVPPPLDDPRARSRGRREATALEALEFRRPLALVFGNEHLGLTQEALQACDERFCIPLQGFSESLNLSVSVAVALHAVVSARRRMLGRMGDLSPAARDRLRAGYYALSTRHAAALVLRGMRAEEQTSQQQSGRETTKP
jgi:tRNA (guanosine-2'-O-)-methyltransferase